ncbi:MAG: FkbM family methyltransferase [Rivularia sp. (in: cyanobacteria)]
MNALLSKSALWLHKQHSKAYSYYKIRKSNISTKTPLTWQERNFYLKLQPGLQEQNLVIYDIGAAKGVVSCLLAKLSNVASVQAFEPIPDVYKELRHNTRSSRKVNCHNVALGDTPGLVTMQVNKRTDTSSLLPIRQLHQAENPGREVHKEIQVTVVPLDEYVKQNNLPVPSLIKIDVQGFEKNVILGGVNTICQAKYCVLEMSLHPVHVGSPLFDDIYRLMCDLGFQLTGLSSPLTDKSGIQLQVDGFFENQKYLSTTFKD